MAGFGSWATGYAPYELAAGQNGKLSNQQRDFWGDPDCPGCGFQIIADPAQRQSIQNTLDLINKGGPFPYKQDGTVYLNKGPGNLPAAEKGYYHEYTVPMPGATNRGTVRLVVGGNGEVYLTPDHYGHFIRIR
jgi:ribonuclease T1